MIDQAAQTYPYPKGCEEKTGLFSRADLDEESLTESHSDSHAPAQDQRDQCQRAAIIFTFI
jgi:hypothetical protein